MPPVVEARIVELRRAHPSWGPRTIGDRLGKEGADPVPGRSSIYRCLVRHGLITPEARKRTRSDYKRWERSRAMELWQMDIVGGVRLADGSEAKIVSGIDDHSRFIVSAAVVARATARPTCDALLAAIGRYGAPQQILTDNGKVFTGRYGPGTGQVLSTGSATSAASNICDGAAVPDDHRQDRAVAQDLARRVPHRQDLTDIGDAQAQLDDWVGFYNHDRPHQSLGMAAPWERFCLAEAHPADDHTPSAAAETATGRIARRAWQAADLGCCWSG